jgi:isocitrate dehydrogenase (NAD+)
MQLVSNPWQFDVVILTNLYGNIVSNLVAGLIGGPGLIGGSNYGPQYAVFETGTRNAAQVSQTNVIFSTPSYKLQIM